MPRLFAGSGGYGEGRCGFVLPGIRSLKSEVGGLKSEVGGLKRKSEAEGLKQIA